MVESVNAACVTGVETIGDTAGGAGGVHDAPRGFRSTTKELVDESGAVQVRATARRVADEATSPAGAPAVWPEAGAAVRSPTATARVRKVRMTGTPETGDDRLRTPSADPVLPSAALR